MFGLTYIRKLYNYSMEDLSKKLGVSKQTISKWENQKIPISDKRLKQLSEIFKIPEEYFNTQLSDTDELLVQKTKLESEIKYVNGDKNKIFIENDEDNEKAFELDMVNIQIVFKDVFERLMKVLGDDNKYPEEIQEDLVILNFDIALFEKCNPIEIEVVIQILSVLNDYFEYGHLHHKFKNNENKDKYDYILCNDFSLKLISLLKELKEDFKKYRPIPYEQFFGNDKK